MRRAQYHTHLTQDLYEILDETSEGLIIEYVDDFNNTTLKIERKQRKDNDDNGDISE